MRTIRIIPALLILTLAIIAPRISLAAFNDVTLTTDAVISIGEINLNVSGSSAVVSSITVGASSFSFNLQSGSSLQVTSTSGKVLTTDGTSYITVNTCTSGQSILKHASTNADVLVTVTPQTYGCGLSATNSGSAGTVSFGGGGGFSPVAYATVPPVPGCPAGFVCTPSAATKQTNTSASVSGVSAVFRAHMSFGSKSADVTRLQKLLATDKSVYPEGRITGYFGPLTRKAVENFQIKYKVAKKGDAGFGTVGPMTRAALKKVFGSQ